VVTIRAVAAVAASVLIFLFIETPSLLREWACADH
jgi:hypothetical protein